MPIEPILSRTMDDVRSINFPPAKYHCDVLIPAGVRVAFSGEPGAGKSVLALNIAVALAEGRDFMGYKVPEPIKVYYLNLEQPEPQFIRRVRLMDEHAPITHNGNLRFATLRGYQYGRDYARIMRDLETFKPKMVIFDTLIEMLGDLRENDSGDIAKFFRQLETYRTSDDETQTILSHFNKGGNDAGGTPRPLKDRVRGSGGIIAAVENIFAVEGFGGGRVKLSEVKLRDHLGMDPIQMYITDSYTVEHGSGEPVSPELIFKVLKVLAMPGNPPLKATAIGDAAGVSKSQIFKVLRELKARGWAENSKGLWEGTPAAKTAQSHRETGQSHLAISALNSIQSK